MLRKIVFRLFICFVALMSTALLTVCIVGYLAFRQPGYYADLRAQQFSASDQMAAKAAFQLMENELRRWNDRSVALQRTQLSPSHATILPMMPVSKYDPQHDTHTVTITERQINSQLASAEGKADRPLQNFRVRINQDRIALGCELVTPKASCVLSIDLNPTLTPEGQLRLDLVSARIGTLPLPMRTLLHWLPLDDRDLGRKMKLDLTGPTPHICLDISDDDPEVPSMKSLTCSEGQVTVEFRAPVLNLRKSADSTTPLAASHRD